MSKVLRVCMYFYNYDFVVVYTCKFNACFVIHMCLIFLHSLSFSIFLHNGY